MSNSKNTAGKQLTLTGKPTLVRAASDKTSSIEYDSQQDRFVTKEEGDRLKAERLRQKQREQILPEIGKRKDNGTT